MDSTLDQNKVETSNSDEYTRILQEHDYLLKLNKNPFINRKRVRITNNDKAKNCIKKKLNDDSTDNLDHKSYNNINCKYIKKSDIDKNSINSHSQVKVISNYNINNIEKKIIFNNTDELNINQVSNSNTIINMNNNKTYKNNIRKFNETAKNTELSAVNNSTVIRIDKERIYTRNLIDYGKIRKLSDSELMNLQSQLEDEEYLNLPNSIKARIYRARKKNYFLQLENENKVCKLILDRLNIKYEFQTEGKIKSKTRSKTIQKTKMKDNKLNKDILN